MIELGTLEAVGAGVGAFCLGAWRVWKVVSDKMKKSQETSVKVDSGTHVCLKEKEMDSLAIQVKNLSELVCIQGKEISEIKRDIHESKNDAKETSEHMATMREDIGWLRGAISTLLGARIK